MSASLKHVTIREYVRTLVAGAPPGSAAPSERELVDRFGVARMTVRHALDGLVAEGVLERFPGRGTFVARPRRSRSRVTGLTEDLARRSIVAESRTLLAVQCAAPARIAAALGVETGGTVVRWRRVRLADGRPLCLSDTFLPERFAEDFLGAEPPDSLYAWLAEHECRPTWADDAVSAGAATADDARLLEVEEGHSLLRQSRRSLWGETPVEISRTLYRGDAHVLSLQFEQ